MNGGARPGPGSRKGSSFTPRPPSVASISGTQTPVPHPAPPPTATIHAPQPRLPFQPSPDWTYAALPPVSNAGHTGIVSTPSWTAVIPAAASSGSNGAPQISPPSQAGALPNSSMPTSSSSALGHGSTPAYAPFQNLQAPSGMPSDPFAFAAAAAAANASGSGSGSAFPFASTSSGTMASPSFPPNATIFSDLPAALSSAPPIGAPPAFFSSYGMYQPVVAPYPRFLTPSPEPSVLGELELELGPSAGEFVPPENNNDGLDEVWKDLEERDGVQQHVSSDGLVHHHHQQPQQPKKDPFEGMTLAQMRSRANSLEAVDRAAATAAATSRYNFYASAEDQIASAAEEVKLAGQAMQTSVSPPSDEAGSNSASTAAGGGPGKKAKRKANGASSSMAGGNSKKNRSANTVAFAAPAAAVDAENDPNPDGSKPALNGGRKNRNPHSTQLPGPRRQGKADGAEDGHEGPICSHCGSVTTPLWRRGPDDELLCNACVSTFPSCGSSFSAEHP
jgi:hypothetical protein